jgi:hypothetical protein
MQGYYKTSFLMLKNSELFLYSDEKSMKLEQMLILAPGVFVVKKKEQHITTN